MDLKFRTLRADEIDCRVAQIKPNGVVLLLYKDARCDMTMLDEAVGPMNWQRTHSRDNANCIVYIWDSEKGQWVGKEDTGTESNTEAQKGLASDSFKRACFNWGIGRELYSAPFIWVPADKCEIKTSNGKSACYDKFAVLDISYTDGRITDLTIWNQSKTCMAFDMGRKPQQKPESAPIYVKEENGVRFAKCAKCGGYIYDAKRKDGTVMPVDDYVAACLKEFGEPRCRKCMK